MNANATLPTEQVNIDIPNRIVGAQKDFVDRTDQKETESGLNWTIELKHEVYRIIDRAIVYQ